MIRAILEKNRCRPSRPVSRRVSIAGRLLSLLLVVMLVTLLSCSSPTPESPPTPPASVPEATTPSPEAPLATPDYVPEGTPLSETPAPETSGSEPSPALAEEAVAAKVAPAAEQPAAAPAPEAVLTPEQQQLQREIDELQMLVDGILPEGIDPGAYLGVDLDDAATCRETAASLKKQLRENAARLESPAAPEGKAQKKEAADEQSAEEPPVDPETLNLLVQRDYLKYALLLSPATRRDALFAQADEQVRARIQPELDKLQREIDALESIVAGRLPEGLEVRSLFETDLRNEQAVLAQVQILQARLRENSEKLAAFSHQSTAPNTPPETAPAAEPPAPKPAEPKPIDATPVEETAGPDVSPTPALADSPAKAEAPSPTPSASTPTSPETAEKAASEVPAASPTPAPIAPESSAGQEADAETSEIVATAPETPAIVKPARQRYQPEKQLLVLQVKRDGLRLAFLTQAAEKRAALLDADEKRQRIAEEQAAAERARLEAERAGREAEMARQAALEEARQAQTAAAKALAGERARAEQMRGSLAQLRLLLSEERRVNANANQEALERQNQLRRQIDDPELAADAADQLYDNLVSLLTVRRAALHEALQNLSKPTRVTPFKPELNLDAPPYVTFGADRDTLAAIILEIVSEIRQLSTEEKDSRWNNTQELAADVKQINKLRLTLLTRLSHEKRGSVLGFTREGFAQFHREVDQLRLMAAFYTLQTSARLRALRHGFWEIFTPANIGWTMFQLLALFGAWYLLRKKYASWWKRLRDGVMSGRGDQTLRMVFLRWLNLLGGILPSVGFLVFLYLLFHVIRRENSPEIDFLRTLVLAYGWYRVCLAVPHELITSTVRSHRIDVSLDLSNRILRSIRTIGRYIFAVTIFLIFSGRILGRGYLYTLVVRFAWLGVVPIVAILLNRWRESITVSYLESFPDGRLAGAMRTLQNKRHGLFVVAAAFFPVAARGIRISLRDSLLRFRHTRKAFSYLFRRQLEKKAEALGQTNGLLAELPPAVVAAFADQPAPPELTVDHYPHLPKVLEHLQVWAETGRGTAIALIGESGVGRTTWLRALERSAEVANLVSGELDNGADSPTELCASLSRLLGLPVRREVEALVADLQAGPPRFILLDQCQNLVLKAVNGLQSFAAFGEIVGRTTPRIGWLCSFTRYAWEFAESVLPTRNIFRHVYELRPWDEKTIKAMIDKRMRVAGFDASYEDLLIDRLDGTEFQSEVIRTGERYQQLLWDYADGLPRVALHFWLYSLAPGENNRLKVRLFNAPGVDELEGLTEQSRFLLAALMVHQTITVAEAARVLNYPATTCELALGYLRDRGFLHDEEGHYAVTAHWQRAVVRFLRRKHLLYS